jgi:hypothetical protein
MSMYRVSVVNLWRSTEETEKKRIISHFIKNHGENYTHDEFLNYLEKRYRSRLAIYRLPVSSKENEY